MQRCRGQQVCRKGRLSIKLYRERGLTKMSMYRNFRDGRRSSLLNDHCDKDGFALHEGMVAEEGNSRSTPFSIELALTGKQRASARHLINEKYGWRGYGSDHNLRDSDECATFTAMVDGTMVGTLSLTVDSPDGLSVDETFPEAIRAMRDQPGTKLCELTKFAFASNATPMHVLASLFHTIFIFGTTRHVCTDLLIEVNPRHIRFYEIMLGFSRVGELQTNDSVDAPSQLMRLKVADIGRYIKQSAGLETRSSRSLYPYFLTAAQECIIQERMADLHKRWPFEDIHIKPAAGHLQSGERALPVVQIQ